MACSVNRSILNPNNCEACDHRQPSERNGGWCGMFMLPPVCICMQHTARYARIKGCQRVLDNGLRCELDSPCPDCGPTLHG